MFPYDPWTDAWNSGVPIVRAPIQPDWGITRWDGDHVTVTIDSSLTNVQARCALTHELVHVRRGEPCQDRCWLDETRTRQITATIMLPDIDNVRLMVWQHGVAAAAEHLGVTELLLLDRLCTPLSGPLGSDAPCLTSGCRRRETRWSRQNCNETRTHDMPTVAATGS